MESNYYAILPANVRYDKELNYLARLLYAEITALSNKEGYCFATNSYFANLYQVTNRTIISALQALLKKGYIKIQIKYKANTKRVIERRIYIVDPVKKSSRGSEKNFTRPREKNFTDNNTSINTKNKYSNFKNRTYNNDILNQFYSNTVDKNVNGEE